MEAFGRFIDDVKKFARRSTGHAMLVLYGTLVVAVLFLSTITGGGPLNSDPNGSGDDSSIVEFDADDESESGQDEDETLYDEATMDECIDAATEWASRNGGGAANAESQCHGYFAMTGNYFHISMLGYGG